LKNFNLKKAFALFYGSGDVGGPFFTQQAEIKPDGRMFHLFGSGASFDTYDGYLDAISIGVSSIDYPTFTSQVTMNALGTRAIGAMLPTNPLSNMGQFLGELQDLPKIPDITKWHKFVQHVATRTKHIDFDKMGRDAAGEYLNGAFGWTPFISDLQSFMKTMQNHTKEAEKYCAGANHLLRRSFHFPSIESATVQQLSSNASAFPATSSYVIPNTVPLNLSTKTVKKQWCSAAFTYYLPAILPSDNDFVQAVKRFRLYHSLANKLYGVSWNPHLLYSLTPWSWALDWISDAGSIVKNWSAFSTDGLTMAYSYVMEEITITKSYTLNGLHTSDGDVNLETRLVSTSKLRYPGTPYGFGANAASFTAKQWGVIAALGISKQPLSINH
jgi:hypothetical protein